MSSSTPPVLREQLGDFGYFGDSNNFYCEGNIFDYRASDGDIGPKQHRIDEQQGYNTDGDRVKTGQSGLWDPFSSEVTLQKPIGLSLPTNDHVNSILAFLSAQFTNKYLVTRVIQCNQTAPRRVFWGELMCTELFHIMYLIVELGNVSYTAIPLCTFATPSVWHRDDNASSTSGS